MPAESHEFVRTASRCAADTRTSAPLELSILVAAATVATAGPAHAGVDEAVGVTINGIQVLIFLTFRLRDRPPASCWPARVAWPTARRCAGGGQAGARPPAAPPCPAGEPRPRAFATPRTTRALGGTLGRACLDGNEVGLSMLQLLS